MNFFCKCCTCLYHIIERASHRIPVIFIFASLTFSSQNKSSEFIHCEPGASIITVVSAGIKALSPIDSSKLFLIGGAIVYESQNEISTKKLSKKASRKGSFVKSARKAEKKLQASEDLKSLSGEKKVICDMFRNSDNPNSYISRTNSEVVATFPNTNTDLNFLLALTNFAVGIKHFESTRHFFSYNNRDRKFFALGQIIVRPPTFFL